MLGAMLRHRELASAPSVSVEVEDASTKIDIPPDDKVGHGIHIADAFGTRSGDFSDACISWLANAAMERGKLL